MSFSEFLIISMVIFIGTVLPATPSCRLSEFSCRNGRCIPSTHFCDNIDDCGDSSDEPRFCSPCNRTYYGDIGRSYELELHRPKEEKLPFICHLVLNADGASYGDLVQVTFDTFTLGQFQSFTQDGCPDGYLQIAEANRPHMGGQWCGTSWGPTIYYSETNSIVITVRLLRLAKDQSGYNFDFRIGFKMLRAEAAVVRFGGATPSPYDPARDVNVSTLYRLPPPTPSPRQYLGNLIPNTYCSRIYNDCSDLACRLQSPNFPGVYPRNLTCYYAVRQHQVPVGQYAMVSIKQNQDELVAIRSSAQLHAKQQQGIKPQRALKVWDECDEVQDYVTIYDGYTTRDPVLLKFCGIGEPIPVVMSSGPELLVEFTSSPYGTFLYPGPAQSFHGFQLEVEVKFVDKESSSYVRNKKCELTIRGSDKGVLESPRHSLPPNTTCTYYLEGVDLVRTAYRPTPGRYPIQYDPKYWLRQTVPPAPRYRVWLSVLKFHVSHAVPGESCNTQLQVWDGTPGLPCNDVFCEKERRSGQQDKSGNLTLLAKYCKDHVPRSCDHSLLGNTSRYPRPCMLTESFLSSGNAITLQLKLQQSTALRPVSFKALYEFVDLHQDGEPFGEGPCSRKFVNRASGAGPTFAQKLQSPRDVFLFGRGGNTNLSCIYRFEGQKGDRLKLTIQQLETGGKPCRSIIHEDTGRAHCYGVTSAATLHIVEFPWPDTPPLFKHCLCSSQGIIPLSFTSTGPIVELRFILNHMNATDDFRNLNFVGSWEFVRQTECTRNQRIYGVSGDLSLFAPSRSPDEVNCEYHPWVIEPTFGKYLYAKIQGIVVPGVRMSYSDIIGNGSVHDQTSLWCETRNRIILQTGDERQIVVCPEPPPAEKHNIVEVFSNGWGISGSTSQTLTAFLENEIRERQVRMRSIMVEFLVREPGYYYVSWLELTRRKPVLPPEGFAMKDCIHRCPELDACINSSLWCDGVSHCPSGYDESLRHCYEIFQLPVLYLAFGVIGLLCLMGAVCIVLVRTCRRRRKRQARLIQRHSDSSLFVDKQVIC